MAVARWCAGHGWPVHPLAAGRKTPAGNCISCQTPGHTATDCPCLTAGRWCHGFHAATTDPDLITAWWNLKPSFGVGVACGPANLVVIDIDAHPHALPTRDRLLPGIAIPESINLTGLANGFHTLALLAALRRVLDPAEDENTLRVRTPSGGLHVWYRVPAGQTWLCSTGTGKGRALAWQVDVRATGGYIIAPGTTTQAGTYAPVGTCRTPALLPEWLAIELSRTGHRQDPHRHHERTQPASVIPQRAREAVIAAGGGRDAASRTLLAALQEVADCAHTPQGAGFSDKLNRAAFTLGGLAAAGHLPSADAERRLLAAAVQARPAQEQRCAQIIRSGMAAGARRPLHLGGRP
ncbi:bifunctional DNA primase/polymerase [Streptacidiphilus sp. EB129]|uniref:bifunctional DNA primase/polymerase n=1 Tax=Streptacidiphilus sp. EB129 TaxID=3156262 RepID=UPI00351638E7